MRDGKNQIFLGGLGAAVLLPAGFVATNAVLKLGDTVGYVILALLLAILLTVGAVVCAAVALRAYMRRVLQTVSNRLDRAVKMADGAAARRHAELMAEQRRALSVAESTIRPHVEGNSAKLATLERGLKDVQSFLQKEGNAQEVLDKLLVVERRLMSSVDSVALTTSDRLGAALSDLSGDLQLTIDQLRGEFGTDRSHAETIASEVTSKLHELHQGIDAMHSTLVSTIPRAELASENLESATGEIRASVKHVEIQIRDSARELGELIEVAEASVVESIANTRRDMDEQGQVLASLGSLTKESAATLAATLDEMKANCEQVDTAIGEMSSELNRHTGSVLAGLQPIQTAADDSASSLSEGMNAFDSRLGQLHGAVDELRAHLVPGLDELADRIGALSGHVGALGPDVERHVGSLDGAISTIHAKLDETSPSLEHRLVELDNKLDELNLRTAEPVDGSNATRSDAVDSSTSARDLKELGEMLQTVLHLTDTAKNDVKTLSRHVDRAGTETVRQVEALLQLLPRVETDTKSFPQTGGFAMNPDGLLLLSDLVMRETPRSILELGSGTSTVWMATFAKSVGATLVSVDHLVEYRDRTAQMLKDAGLSDVVDLRLAPLVEFEFEGAERTWYDPLSFDDLGDIDLLIVDGPPESTGPDPRFPAFPLLREKLASGATVVVDDFHREQEAKMVESWMSEDQRLRQTPWAIGRTGVLRFDKQD